MNIVKYIAFYYHDWLTALAGKSAAFRGAYITALAYYWSKECAGLPDDDSHLRFICECTAEEWADIKDELFQREGGEREYFRIDETGKWHQHRGRVEYATAQEIANKRSAAGKKGMAVRYGKA